MRPQSTQCKQLPASSCRVPSRSDSACIHIPNPEAQSQRVNPNSYHMVKPAGMPLGLRPMELPAPAPAAFFSFFSTMIACACNAPLSWRTQSKLAR